MSCFDQLFITFLGLVPYLLSYVRNYSIDFDDIAEFRFHYSHKLEE